MQVCPFDDPTVPFTPPGNYVAIVTSSDTTTPGADSNLPTPRWRYFAANPALDWSPKTTPGNTVGRLLDQDEGLHRCRPARSATWRRRVPGTSRRRPDSRRLTTVGNNANTHEAWVSPLSPGGTAQAPVSPTREYTEKFTDAWNNSQCDPTQLHPGGNDINQVVTNLFVAHNRMHDYSYYLGFTETNYNLQQDNLGRGGVANDPRPATRRPAP